MRVDYEMQLGPYNGSEPDTEAFLWAHNLQEKGRKIYNRDFKTHYGYDLLESYEPKCEQYVMNDRGSSKLHLIFGVQKARIIRHYYLKVDDIISMNTEVRQVEIKVMRGKEKGD